MGLALVRISPLGLRFHASSLLSKAVVHLTPDSSSLASALHPTCVETRRKQTRSGAALIPAPELAISRDLRAKSGQFGSVLSHASTDTRSSSHFHPIRSRSRYVHQPVAPCRSFQKSLADIMKWSQQAPA